MALVAGAAGVSWLGTASAGPSQPSRTALRSTSTSVSCTPSALELGQTATCTAAVSDIDKGKATTPTGTVAFSATSKDAFPSPSACTLSAGSCQIIYTSWGGAPSTVTVTASYGGDSSHGPSAGTQDIAVSPLPCSGLCPKPPPPPPGCSVPRVIGQKLAQAKKLLRRSLCRAGRISRAFSKHVEPNRVISEKPGPGRLLAQGAKVQLVVSKGKRP